MKTRGFEVVKKYQDKGINLPRRQTVIFFLRKEKRRGRRKLPVLQKLS